MDLNVFIEKFASCFSENEAKQITPDTEFRKLGEWNSMMALILISTIDEELGQTLSAEDIRSSVTVSDLYKRLTKQ